MCADGFYSIVFEAPTLSILHNENQHDSNLFWYNSF